MGVRQRLAAASAAALVLPAVLALPAQAQTDVDVLIVHGIPGAVVDVYADLGAGAERLIDDFAFGGDDNPFALVLPAGAEAEITVVAGDAAEGDLSNPLIGPETVTVPDVDAASLVAHIGGDGEGLLLTAFEDPVEPTCTGEGLVLVRHTAGAGTVDVTVDGEVVLEGLDNGEEDGGFLPEGTYEVALVASGTDDVVLGPVDLDVPAGFVTTVYAVGSVSDDTLDLLVIDYEVGETDEGDCASEPTPTPTTAKPVPTEVPAGQGTAAGAGTGAVIAGIAFLGLLTAGVVAAVRSRRQGAGRARRQGA